MKKSFHEQETKRKLVLKEQEAQQRKTDLEMRDTRRIKFMEDQNEQQRAVSLDKRQKKDAKIEQAKQQAEFQI